MFEGLSSWLCVWVHLGTDDSLGGSLNVGRQTKECRSVILWEILYYAAVVLERHVHIHLQVKHTHTLKKRKDRKDRLKTVIMALKTKTIF